MPWWAVYYWKVNISRCPAPGDEETTLEMVTDMGSWEFTSSHLCTACLYTSPMLARRTVLLRSFSTLSPWFLHALCPAVPSTWAMLALVSSSGTQILWWICDKQPQQQHHELRLAHVWGVELSEDLEQICWNTSVFTLFKITDAQVLRNPTWGHPVPPGPRKGLNHSWKTNYQEKIFWEQKTIA